MSYVRLTPAPGTPERLAFDTEWEAIREAISNAATILCEKKDTLDAQYRKLQDKYVALCAANEPQGKLKRRMWLEDTFTSGDSANRLAAQVRLAEEFKAIEPVKEVYEQMLAIASEHISGLGVTDEADHRSVAQDVTSMLLGCPGIRTLADQARSSLNFFLRKKRERLRTQAVDGLVMPDQEKRRFHDLLKQSEYDEVKSDKLVEQARATSAMHLQRLEYVKTCILNGIRTGHGDEAAMIKLLDNSCYDETTRSNVAPIELEEAKIVIRTMIKDR